jgi:glycosyltransferase involved in cell wall biosynthesis
MATALPVDICGFIDDPSPLYASADIFINPSLGPEGLPMVSLEAMSYGLPCILSDLPVHREISLEGKAAVLFEAGSSASLGAKLEQLSRDIPALRSYGRAARMLVEERYSPEAVRERYNRIFVG